MVSLCGICMIIILICILDVPGSDLVWDTALAALCGFHQALQIHFNIMAKTPKWSLPLTFSDQIFVCISYVVNENWEVISLSFLPTGKMYVVGLIPSLGEHFSVQIGHNCN